MEVTMARANSKVKGFSLLECCAVLGVVGIVLAFATMGSSTATQTSQAESGVALVQRQLRVARMTAITQRRNVVVSFDTSFGTDNAQHVNYQVVTLDGEPAQALQSVPLPSGTQFVLETGVPDTPDGFGNSTAVCFGTGCGGSAVMQFTTTGEFVDGNYQPLNGTIFLGIPGAVGSARAVTIGSGGNIQRFSWMGTQWVR
jgi:prepilin-type N-terminal cleavage/methylation domain-containing protein